MKITLYNQPDRLANLPSSLT